MRLVDLDDESEVEPAGVPAFKSYDRVFGLLQSSLRLQELNFMDQDVHVELVIKALGSLKFNRLPHLRMLKTSFRMSRGLLKHCPVLEELYPVGDCNTRFFRRAIADGTDILTLRTLTLTSELVEGHEIFSKIIHLKH
jgi:hypothetical protein